MFNVSSIGMFMYKEVNRMISLSFVIFSGKISVVGKRGRILGIIISIFNTNFKNVSYVFVKFV